MKCKWVVKSFTSAVVLAAGLRSAHADELNTLLNKVPSNTNAVVVANISAMMRSPIAQQQRWAEAMALDYIGGILPFPPETQTAVLAFQVDLRTLSSTRQVTLFQAGKSLNLDFIAQTERGSRGTIGGGLPMVQVPRTNSFVIDLGNQLYASATPALTTEVSNWLKATKTAAGLSENSFLREMLRKTNGESLVFVFNMEEMLDENVLRKNLHKAKSLQGKSVDVDDLSKLIAGIKGVRLGVRIGVDFEASFSAEFKGITARFKDILPALTQETLEHMGLGFEDISGWQANFTDHGMKLQGKLSELTFRRLLAMVAPPQVPVLAEPMDSPGDPQAGIVRSSRRYLTALDKLLSDLRNQIPKCRDYNEAATITENFAKRISRLPQANVDEELLSLAGRTEAQLRAVANSYRGARLDWKALDAERQESLMLSAGGAYAAGFANWWGGYAGAYYVPGSFWYSNNFHEVNVKQAKLVASSSKERDDLLPQMYEDVTNIRQELAAKYKTSF